MKLYTMDRAPNPRRVEIFLAEKGMDIEKINVDIPSGENLQPAYLTVNPRGLVPTLVTDDGTALGETVAICRYIEGLMPTPNLLGETPLELAQIEQAQREMEFDGLATFGTIFRNTSPYYKDRALPGATGPIAQLPELVIRSEVLADKFFDDLDARLADQAYIAGDRFTIADITGFIVLVMAKWVKKRPKDTHQHIHRWHQAVSARRSFATGA